MPGYVISTEVRMHAVESELTAPLSSLSVVRGTSLAQTFCEANGKQSYHTEHESKIGYFIFSFIIIIRIRFLDYAQDDIILMRSLDVARDDAGRSWMSIRMRSFDVARDDKQG